MNAASNGMAPGDSSVVKNAGLELSKQTSGCVVICCDQYGNKSSTKPRPWIGDFDANVNQIDGTNDVVLGRTHENLAGMHHSPHVNIFFTTPSCVAKAMMSPRIDLSLPPSGAEFLQCQPAGPIADIHTNQTFTSTNKLLYFRASATIRSYDI